MKELKIICDSLADIPKYLVNKYDIEVVPLTIRIDEVDYKDGINISNKDFYEKIKSIYEVPKTSQATYVQFSEIFNKYIDENKDILYISGSSKVTGTLQSATMAKKDIEGNIYLFDSFNLSYGCGAQVVKACEMREEGFDVDDIIKKLERIQEDILVLFEVDSLEYLLKGGRITKSKAVVGNMLNIKPVLSMEDGEIKELIKIRGKKHVISKIIEIIKKKFDNNLSNKEITVANGDNYKDMLRLKEAIEKEFNVKVSEAEIGPSIGSHTGPGTIGVCISQK